MPISRPKLRAARRLGAALAAVGALALVLTGCGGSPAPTQSPTPTEAAPIFASDDEALAAFSGAYEAFLIASIEVTNHGGQGAEALGLVATGQALEDELEAAERFLAEGLTTQGSASFSVHELQAVDQHDDSVTVTAYVCEDISALDLVDSGGKSVVNPDRVTDVPYSVAIEGTSANAMKVSEKTLWERDNFCRV